MDDESLIRLWLHGRSANTTRAYRGDVGRFLGFVRKSLVEVGLPDLQQFDDTLSGLAPASRGRVLGSLKSLFHFLTEQGFLARNPTMALKPPRGKNTLAERILTEEQTMLLLALELDPVRHAILKLLYVGGLRVSELCGLCWRDLQEREDGGQATIFGKAAKTRSVVLPPGIWHELAALRGAAGPDDPVFPSPRGKHLSPVCVWRLVRAAGRRAGIKANVSPHFLRHCHGSHALDRGAPLDLIRDTLGHASIATTSKYLHSRPRDSSSRYLPV